MLRTVGLGLDHVSPCRTPGTARSAIAPLHNGYVPARKVKGRRRDL